jgi:hypothetical protein
MKRISLGIKTQLEIRSANYVEQLSARRWLIDETGVELCCAFVEKIAGRHLATLMIVGVGIAKETEKKFLFQPRPFRFASRNLRLRCRDSEARDQAQKYSCTRADTYHVAAKKLARSIANGIGAR